MKQALLNLLDTALRPFGLRAVTQSHLNQVGWENDHNRLLADLYRRVCLQPTEMPSKTTLPPRRKRRGRRPMVERLTMAQVKMVRDKRLSTYRLAKKLGVAWPTANKLRDELA